VTGRGGAATHQFEDSVKRRNVAGVIQRILMSEIALAFGVGIGMGLGAREDQIALAAVPKRPGRVEGPAIGRSVAERAL